MPDRPHRDIQTPSEMLATAKEQRLNNRIYSKTADSGLVVSAIVSQLAEDLTAIPQKVDFRDTELVKNVCIAYADACSQAGLIPNKMGLSRALGVSRRTVDLFCDLHPDHPTAQLLEIVFDAFSEALSNAALVGATNNIFSIFVSKAIYKWKDTVSVETTPPDPMDHHTTAAEILAKYSKEDLDLLPD